MRLDPTSPEFVPSRRTEDLGATREIPGWAIAAFVEMYMVPERVVISAFSTGKTLRAARRIIESEYWGTPKPNRLVRIEK